MFIVVHLRFIAYCPQIPESDDLLIIIYKKDVEPVPVTRSTFRGLRIAQLVETSNAEAPRRYVQQSNDTLLSLKYVEVYKHTRDIYRCYVFDKP